MTRGTAALHGPAQTPAAQTGGEPSWDAHTIVIRMSGPNRPGMLAKVASAIGANGGNIGAIDALEITAEAIVRDISIAVSSQEHERRVVDAVRGVEGINPHLAGPPRRQDRDRLQEANQDPGGPLHLLHARRRRSLPGHPR